MEKRGKSSERTASNRAAKRPKVQAPLEANAPTVTWSDLHYDVIRDIFRHLPTTKQARCRRVSKGWNNLLVEQLSRSSVISLQYHDLKKWETIFCPPARETRRAIEERKMKLVTEHTYMLIMDFGNIEMQLKQDLNQVVFGFRCGNRGPASMVMENHPQINRIVIYRARLITSYYARLSEKRFLSFLGVGSYLVNGAPVAMLGCATMQKACQTKMWATSEEYVNIKKWYLPWPKVNLMDSEPETKYQYHETLMEIYSAYWHYPPEQLEWLGVCLAKLSTEDRFHAYLDCNFVFEKLDDRCCVTLLGRTYLTRTAALCARYLTTFRKELDLPPPPHPLVWKD